MTQRRSEIDKKTEPDLLKTEELDYKDIMSHMRGDQNFNGPIESRKCTDTFFLVLFMIGNCGLIGLSIYTFLNGDPSKLTKGFDIRGHACGIGTLSSKPFMFFPNQNTTDWSLCVEACPYYYYSNYYCIYDKDRPDKYYPEWGCWDAYQTSVYGFFCIPVEEESRKMVLNYLSSTMQVLKRNAGDLVLAWDLILIGVMFSCILGFSFLLGFKKANVIKWIVIASIPTTAGLLGFLIYLLIYAAERSIEQLCGNYGPAVPKYCDRKAEKVYLGLAYALIVLGSFYIYKIISKFKDFPIGINMIEITSKPLHVMRELLIFPFIQITIGLSLLVLLSLLLLWTMSASNKKRFESKNVPGGVAYRIEYTVFEEYILVYNVLMAAWWVNFLVDIGNFVLSGAVATWYFSREKSVLYGPVFKSFKVCIKYHIGSLALGSLIRPITAVPTLLIEPVAKYLVKVRSTSPWYKILLSKLCRCANIYFSKLRYLKKKNYIFVLPKQLAIFGQTFFQSGVQVLHLMRRNNIRIGRPCKIGEFIIYIFQIIITLSGPILTFALTLLLKRTTRGQLTIELEASIGPFMFVLVFSWFIGRVFSGALQVSLNAVLISAACDEEMFTREQRFIEQDLLDFMDGIGEEQNEQHREHKMRINVVSENEEPGNWDRKIIPFEEKWADDRSNASRLSSRQAGFDLKFDFAPPENSFVSYLGDEKGGEEAYGMGREALFVDD